MASRGRLIVLEGPDGVGKTTIAKPLARRLRSVGISRVCELSFPKGAKHSLGQVIYKIHHNPGRFGIRRIDRTSLQVLHTAAHIDTIETAIRPHLGRGGWVVLDRYWWSTWVYGVAYDVPAASVKAMIDLELVHWADLMPDLLILIDRETPFRSESDVEHFQQLRRLYERLERREGSHLRIHRLSNKGTPSDAVDECMRVLGELLERDQTNHLEGIT